jgi:hypothetical protein
LLKPPIIKMKLKRPTKPGTPSQAGMPRMSTGWPGPGVPRQRQQNPGGALGTGSPASSPASGSFTKSVSRSAVSNYPALKRPVKMKLTP